MEVFADCIILGWCLYSLRMPTGKSPGTFAISNVFIEVIRKKGGPKRREAAKVLALTASRGVSSKWLVTNLDARRGKRFPACADFLKKFLRAYNRQ